LVEIRAAQILISLTTHQNYQKAAEWYPPNATGLASELTLVELTLNWLMGHQRSSS
jgi:hypothetical protein